MRCEHLEEAQVLVVEGADLAQPVPDHHQTDRPGLAAEHRDHTVADTQHGEEAQSIAAARPRLEDGRGGRDHPGDELLPGLVEIHRVHRLDPADADPGTDHHLALPGGEDDDLRHLRAEGVARALEHVEERRIEVLGVLQVTAGVVEEGDLLTVLALRHVGAITKCDASHGDHQQPDDLEVEPHQVDDDQAQADVDHHAEHGQTVVAEHAAAVGASLGEEEGHHEHRRLERAGQGDRDQGRQAGPDADGVAAGSQQGEERHRHRSAEGEVPEVEGELQRGLMPMQRQGHGGAEEAGQDHRHRTVEEQPDDQGALAEREGLGLAPKLDVDHADLGDAEERGEQPPGDRVRRRRLRKRDDGRRGEGGRPGEGGGEQRHPPHAGGEPTGLAHHHGCRRGRNPGLTAPDRLGAHDQEPPSGRYVGGPVRCVPDQETPSGETFDGTTTCACTTGVATRDAGSGAAAADSPPDAVTAAAARRPPRATRTRFLSDQLSIEVRSIAAIPPGQPSLEPPHGPPYPVRACV